MTCATGTICQHSADCADHHCPGRGTADDSSPEALGLLSVVVVCFAIVTALVIYARWGVV
jgi:hypothetical protein